jgi:molybdate transport system substrate-binding protein
MPRKTLLALVMILSLLSLLPAHAQQSQTLIVFAASSLSDAFESIAAAFEAQNPGVDVLFNFAGSSDLAAQLGNGAPADVFASANNRQMQAVIDDGRISDSPQIFARNRLILAVPDFNPAEIASLDDLTQPGINMVIATEAVPVREYTDSMLDAMAADPVYGEAYRQAFMANVVSEEPNVRQVAAKVALGEADAGIIYYSDVTPDIADQVLIIPIPDAYNTIATYPIAALNDSPNAELASAFVTFVLSDEGQAILETWNFVRAEAEALTIDGQVLRRDLYRRGLVGPRQRRPARHQRR